MTLSFSTKLKGKNTYFPQKILEGIWLNKLVDFDIKYLNDLINKLGKTDLIAVAKIHTIRADPNNKWKKNNLIHFVINNRTKNRYQFAPVIKVVSIQQIKIWYSYNQKNEMWNIPNIIIDGKELTKSQIIELAKNDGFDTLEDFFNYFNADFTGKIIHWTTYKY